MADEARPVGANGSADAPPTAMAAITESIEYGNVEGPHLDAALVRAEGTLRKVVSGAWSNCVAVDDEDTHTGDCALFAVGTFARRAKLTVDVINGE